MGHVIFLLAIMLGLIPAGVAVGMGLSLQVLILAALTTAYLLMVRESL